MRDPSPTLFVTLPTSSLSTTSKKTCASERLLFFISETQINIEQKWRHCNQQRLPMVPISFVRIARFLTAPTTYQVVNSIDFPLFIGSV